MLSVRRSLRVVGFRLIDFDQLRVKCSVPCEKFFLHADPFTQSFGIVDRFGLAATRAAAFAPIALFFDRQQVDLATLGEQQSAYFAAQASHCTSSMLQVASLQLLMRSLAAPHCMQELTTSSVMRSARRSSNTKFCPL